MKPIPFKEQNKTFGKDQPEYGNLPAYLSPTSGGEMITCWKLTFWERLLVLFTGKVWHCTMTFHKPPHPLILAIKKNEIVGSFTIVSKKKMENHLKIRK